jgi:hypothetical protein
MQYGRISGGMQGEKQLYVNRRREPRQPAVMVVGPARSQHWACDDADGGVSGPSCHPRTSGDPDKRDGLPDGDRIALTGVLSRRSVSWIPACAGMT